MKTKYSETFFSLQGEGKYSGHPSVWLRFANCNLQCHGFGQTNPKDPDTYILDFIDYDPVANNVKCVEDLPVWNRGCDSSYTWAPKYKHLLRSATAVELADILTDHMRNEHNPDGLFLHPKSGQHNHMCFTGGEPMFSQLHLIAVMEEFIARGNVPQYITIETNCTNDLRPEFHVAVQRWQAAGVKELFFSCSPKLYSVSGEKPEKAIRPDVMEQYAHLEQLVQRTAYRTVSKHGRMTVSGQIKIVANGTAETWEEFDSAVAAFRAKGINWPVYAMPCGATLEEQEIKAADVATQATERGFIVAPRIHVYLFGNAIGT